MAAYQNTGSDGSGESGRSCLMLEKFDQEKRESPPSHMHRDLFSAPGHGADVRMGFSTRLPARVCP